MLSVALSDSNPAACHPVFHFRPPLKIGEVQLAMTGSTGRCVMTTLAQGDLPKDTGILRTAVQQNEGNVGVYAQVVQGGTIKCGDRVQVI